MLISFLARCGHRLRPICKTKKMAAHCNSLFHPCSDDDDEDPEEGEVGDPTKAGTKATATAKAEVEGKVKEEEEEEDGGDRNIAPDGGKGNVPGAHK